VWKSCLQIITFIKTKISSLAKVFKNLVKGIENTFWRFIAVNFNIICPKE